MKNARQSAHLSPSFPAQDFGEGSSSKKSKSDDIVDGSDEDGGEFDMNDAADGGNVIDDSSIQDAGAIDVDEGDEFVDMGGDSSSSDGEDGMDSDDSELESGRRRKKNVSPSGVPPGTPPRLKQNLPGKSAEAGIITQVYVENFMCHRKLTVPFCPNVNFINGANGSGKSAILAAIQICLGAQARKTGRAKTLKDLIRKGR
mgnify:CR=1 FL=1